MSRTRLFLFQQGRSGATERAFRILAEVTGGAYFPFNPHIERVAERLPGMLEAITRFVISGMAAFEFMSTVRHATRPNAPAHVKLSKRK
jgi:hypothetical protein